MARRPGPPPPRRRRYLASALLFSLASHSLEASAFSLDGPTSPSTMTPSTPPHPPPTPQHEYPRPLHPGGFSLPPLVEDRLPLVAPSNGADSGANGGAAKMDLLLVRPPDMESLWEWYAYTKSQTETDPSWGRVWPTALSLARLVLREMNNTSENAPTDEKTNEKNGEAETLEQQAFRALRTASHAVELGCGLGVAGLAYASAASARNDDKRRTLTFLEREPYALHCAMSSAAANGLATGPIGEAAAASDGDGEDVPRVTVRGAIDDWTLPTSDDETDNSQIKNMRHRDLHVNSSHYTNPHTILLASDILYEPSSMASLASKMQNLLHPQSGGYALIADPAKERTQGCRDAFVKAVKALGGEVKMCPMPELAANGKGLLDGDVDIDGTLARTVLLVVRFGGTAAGP